MTTHGDRVEGYIRWDQNEGSWADLWDATGDVTGVDWSDFEEIHFHRP